VKKRGRKPLSQRTDLDIDFPRQQRSPSEILSPDATVRQYSFVGTAYSPVRDGSHRNEDRYQGSAYGYAPVTSAATPYEDRGRAQDYDSPVADRTDQSVRRISQIINPPLPPSAVASDSQQAATALQQMAAPRIIPQPPEFSKYRECRYSCLEPLMPLLEAIIEPKIACDLLEFYFAEPDSALFRHASPYVLSPVIRRQSLLHAITPRKTTWALLVTILWTTAQTCDLPLLLLPGRRGQVCEQLRVLAMALVHERDRDHWHRSLGD
jgi:hypothetical protein